MLLIHVFLCIRVEIRTSAILFSPESLQDSNAAIPPYRITVPTTSYRGARYGPCPCRPC